MLDHEADCAVVLVICAIGVAAASHTDLSIRLTTMSQAVRPAPLKALRCSAVVVLALVGFPSQVGAAATSVSASRLVPIVDHGSEDVSTYFTSAWSTGTLKLEATRVADGRIKMRMRMRFVARRPFLAQLYMQGCDATIPGAALVDPLAYAPEVLPTYRGRAMSVHKHMRKGVHTVDLTSVLSSDDVAASQPHWTDCAVGGMTDEQETDNATIDEHPEALLRQGSNAFDAPPIILSVTVNGQHLDACDGLGRRGWADPGSDWARGRCVARGLPFGGE
jgi:hypothetical protein